MTHGPMDSRIKPLSRNLFTFLCNTSTSLVTFNSEVSDVLCQPASARLSLGNKKISIPQGRKIEY